jgi:selenocysteine lyase/cysteine desulfurase
LWRRDTPGCQERIHLNNAGAALMPQPVLTSIMAHLVMESALGAYEASEGLVDKVSAAYDAIAEVIGATARNIAVVENATVAVSQALSAFDFQPGDMIVTSRADYPSNQLMYLSLARRLGVRVLRAHDLPAGGVDPESVRELLRRDRCRLVSISWVPTNSGLIQDVEAVGRVCEEAGVPFLVDACQAVGQLPVDVLRLRCDYLAATARKFLRGPRGIGFLYVSDRVLERDDAPLYIDMRGADWIEADQYRLADGARRFENWEFAYALVLGMGEAARYALRVGPIAFTRAHALAEYARKLLTEQVGARILDRGHNRCAIVSAMIPGYDADRIKLPLRRRGVNTSVSDRQSGVIDMDEKGALAVLRGMPGRS